MVAVSLVLTLAAAAHAVETDEGVRGQVRKESIFSQIVPAEKLEAIGEQQYRKTLQEAAAKNALAPDTDPQVIRLRAIAARILPFTGSWNPRAKDWHWEVNLLISTQVNAYCLPGGKIAFYSALLEKVQLTDAEVAMVMGHEISHALREHGRRRVGKSVATSVGVGAVSAILGLHEVGRGVLNKGGEVLTLKFSREDETEADVLGMELAARAGYDPASGVALWQKMGKLGAGKSTPEFLRDHPADDKRVAQIQALLPKVEPIYERAPKPTRNYGPPAAAK